MDARSARGTRAYDARSRRLAAQQRRDRVVDAAATLFVERGWAGTTLRSVAQASGVSVELIGTAFGGKAGLFMAVFRRVGFGDRSALPEAFDSLDLAAEPDLDVRIDRIVDFCCSSLRLVAPLVPVMTTGAGDDDSLRELVVAAQAGHAATSEKLVRLIAAGRPPADAVDEVYLLTRAETYLTLVEQRGWSEERFAAFLRRRLLDAVAPEVGDAVP